MPLDAKDLVPYLAKIPQDTEVLFSVFFGALSIAFYTQAKSMGLEKTMKMYSVSGTIEAIAPADLKGAAEGVYIVENFPRMVKYKDDEFHREYNKLHRHRRCARARDRFRPCQCQEPFLAELREPVRAEEGDRDVRLEDQEGRPGRDRGARGPGDGQLARPSRRAPRLLRKEDHSGMIDCYISRVENDELHVKKKVTKEELMAHLPPRVDLSKQSA